ncbi:putative CCCH-type Zn-finger protein [Gregarina niphandrodes]|uniref:CCCH-type Zn-finger protein n=1 Tax=Gregarina niphandrodes TaxID=110365 RepID=A0A023AXU2_GRENI|nr:putative CCCH-type Zn-finger protein [Gregarina niphandrodes]EZG43454.1 putative CCCH-type Zn-finger protein [Gregarina niphandrodes]|eukprot:XP_011133305.1 putative CCCH-type Zn-finger protein [Gregarina niphandrodes]
MPPKAKAAQSKQELKAKQKVVEDKTFGLKNKNKSKAVQKYIKSVQAQVTGGRVKSEHELKAEQKEKAEEKKRQKQAALLASLQKATEAMKNAADKKTDYKTVTESQRVDIYVDPRAAKQQETMDDWDMSKLEQVIKTKHGGQKTQSEIVCKHFLDALEKRLYGWFWQCPNGDTCQYRHALPPGYVLKKKELPDLSNLPEEESLEEIIERERQALPPGGTPVTYETFMAWKAKKQAEVAKAKEAAAKKKKEDSSGRSTGMSGRALFQYDPSLFATQEEEDDDDDFATMLAEHNQAELEAEHLAAQEAAANLAAAQAAVDGRPLTSSDQDSPAATATTATATNATEQDTLHVRNANLFKDQGETLDPDELDD